MSRIKLLIINTHDIIELIESQYKIFLLLLFCQLTLCKAFVDIVLCLLTFSPKNLIFSKKFVSIYLLQHTLTLHMFMSTLTAQMLFFDLNLNCVWTIISLFSGSKVLLSYISHIVHDNCSLQKKGHEDNLRNGFEKIKLIHHILYPRRISMVLLWNKHESVEHQRKLKSELNLKIIIGLKLQRFNWILSRFFKNKDNGWKI